MPVDTIINIVITMLDRAFNAASWWETRLTRLSGRHGGEFHLFFLIRVVTLEGSNNAPKLLNANTNGLIVLDLEGGIPLPPRREGCTAATHDDAESTKGDASEQEVDSGLKGELREGVSNTVKTHGTIVA
jgi:hypothetical protein